MAKHAFWTANQRHRYEGILKTSSLLCDVRSIFILSFGDTHRHVQFSFKLEYIGILFLDLENVENWNVAEFTGRFI